MAERCSQSRNQKSLYTVLLLSHFGKKMMSLMMVTVKCQAHSPHYLNQCFFPILMQEYVSVCTRSFHCCENVVWNLKHKSDVR